MSRNDQACHASSHESGRRPAAGPDRIGVRGLMRAACCGLLLVLISCSAVTPVDTPAIGSLVDFSEQAFGPRPAIVSPQQIHWLSDDQKRAFLSYFHDPRRAGQSPERRMIRYFDVLVPDFEYISNTFTASQAIALEGGNCLTLAILTASLAQLAGLEYDFQLMEDQPIYALDDDVIQKGIHIRSRVMNPDWEPHLGLLGVRRGITVDYFSNSRERFIRNLGPLEYLAMYYRNIAVEALDGNDLAKAYWYTREALDYVPESSDSLNMLAVVYRRAGNSRAAESIYLHALEQATDKLSLLKNYHLLLVQEGRKREAEIIDRQLEGMEDPSPFNWYHLAQSLAVDGEHRRAIQYYRRALGLAPYLHEAYFGMAKSFLAMDELDAADAAMRSAIANSGRVSTRRLYKAKLTTLLNY